MVLSGQKVTFRAAATEDAAGIIGFQISMAKETESIDLDRAVCANGVQAVFDRSDLGRYYVAEIDGRVGACLLITFEWSDWRNRIVWWIQSVYVQPAFRHGGIYAGLYAYVKNLCENDPAAAGIRLYVDRRNLDAQHVYKRLEMNGDHYQLFEWMKDF